MSETKTPGEKTLSVHPTKTLTLKREQGVVRQSFSHGRTKQVVVEKVKRRAPGAAEGKIDAGPGRATAKATTAAPSAAPPAATPKPSGVVLRSLTEEERSARAHVLAD